MDADRRSILAAQGLTHELLPPPAVAQLPIPSRVNQKGRDGFLFYLGAAPHRAYAVSLKGAWASSFGRRTVAEARAAAIEACNKQSTTPCAIYAADDTLESTQVLELTVPISASGREGFASYLKSRPHRAFAISPKGAWAWKGGQSDPKAARNAALETCEKIHGIKCRIYAADDELEPWQ